jgi:hypothetical protein
MTAAEIEIVEPKRIRIRDRHFDVFYHAPPQSDGSIYDLEASANELSHARNHLKPHELRGIRGRDLPAGLSIMIESPKSHLKNMSLVYFENLNEGPIVKSWIYFDHADWHLPLHLIDFCDLVQEEIASSKDVVRRVEVHESDVGVNLLCVAPVSPLADCYLVFQALDDLILKGYRACLRSLMKDAPALRVKSTDIPVADGHGAKWWIRYVVVPVVVAFVALIALLLR